MAVECYLAGNAQPYMARGMYRWGNGVLKFALLTSAWAPTLQTTAGVQIFDENTWSDVSAHEVAAGSGYTAGGCDLYGGPSAQLAGYPLQDGAITYLQAINPRWSNLTKTFRYGVLYRSGTVDGIVNPLISAYLFDNTPADITVTAANLMLRWGDLGVWSMESS